MSRHITQEGLNLIKDFEGFSESVYICPAGYPTIGYGHLVKKGENFPEEIGEEEAEELLRIDVKSAENSVIRLIGNRRKLSNGQFDALVSFVYNLGAGALQRSTLRQKCLRGDDEAAAHEFLKWCRAGGRVLNGLLKRRKAEAWLYLSLTTHQF